MEVVGASTLLFNQEVLEILRRKRHTNCTPMATVIYETTSYLESCPLSNLDAVKETQHNLSKFEQIQIANLKPQNEIELHLIVDNIEERFTEEQRKDLLISIQGTLEEENARKKIKLQSII